MKRFNTRLVAVVFAMAAFAEVVKSSCTVDITVLPMSQPDEVPEASASYLASRLQQLVTEDNAAAMPGGSRFFITGRFDHILVDMLPGPPVQTALHTYLTLYIGDVQAQKIYSSTTIELRGVGNSTQRAFINALRTVNPENRKVKDFISRGTGKIVDYYDANYQSIISQAERAASMHRYDEALWELSSIPVCSKGYQQASSMMAPLMKKHIDREGEKLVTLANAAWAKSPDADGAAEAFDHLMQVDPMSAAHSKAERLGAEIKKSVKSDIDFETRQKYTDGVATDRLLINAARDVGVAYGRGQKQTTTNLNWIR